MAAWMASAREARAFSRSRIAFDWVAGISECVAHPLTTSSALTR